MSRKISPEMFRESLDRCSSGVHGDPFLAGRIIASGKGERKMKRKMFTSFALALVILFALAAAAYSATVIYRTVNYQGETLETTEEPREYPDEARDYDALCDELIGSVQDSECAIFSLKMSTGSEMTSEHKKQVRFGSWEEFTKFMADVDYMSVPAWLPEYKTFSARIEMDLKDGGQYEVLENRVEGPAVFRRFSFDDADAVITGYEIYLDEDDEDSFVEINSCLAYKDSGRFTVQENEKAEPVTVKGMPEALLVRSSNPQTRNRLYTYKELAGEMRVKDPGCLLQEVPDASIRESFYTKVCAGEKIRVFSGRDPEIMLKIFNGE